jgi:hypothetical protein
MKTKYKEVNINGEIYLEIIEFKPQEKYQDPKVKEQILNRLLKNIR